LSIAVLATTVASAFAMRAVFSPVQDAAKLELHLSDLQLSFVQGLALALPVALLSLPIGRITDRGNRVQLLTALAALWTIGTIGTAFVHDFYGLFFARMLAGLGSSCAIGVAISIAADLSGPSHRGRSLLFLSLGNMIGVAVSFALAGSLLGAFQHSAPIFAGLSAWREVHLAFGALSLLLVAPLLLLREPERHEIEIEHAALGAALEEIWRRRVFLIPLFLGQVTVVMVDTAAGIWAAPVLERDYHLTPEQFGGWMGLVILVAGVIGALIGGFAADFGQKLKSKGGILTGATIAAFVSIPASLFPIMPTIPGFAAVLALFLTCGAICGLITAATIAVLVPNEIRGVCLGAFIVIGAVIGLGVAPTVVSLVSDLLGGEHAIGAALAITGLAVSSIGAVGFALAQRRAGRLV
jgi:MFS family permease